MRLTTGQVTLTAPATSETAAGPQTPARDERPQEAPERPTPEALRAAAHALLAEGWPVHPLRPRRKTPASDHGHLDATDDPTQVDAWWGETPNANPAIAIPEGHVALDLDWERGLDPLVLDLLPTTHTHRTGKGDNHHRIYRTEPGSKAAALANRAALIPGLDVRQAGKGYLVGPGAYVDLDGGDRHETPRLYTCDDRTAACAWLTDAVVDALLALAPERAPRSGPGEPRDTGPGTDDARPLWHADDPAEQAAVSRVLHTLRALGDLPPGATDEHGQGWDAGVFKAACDLFELANSDWTHIAPDQVPGLVRLHAPTDDGFDAGRVEQKIVSARSRTEGKTRPPSLYALGAGGVVGTPETPDEFEREVTKRYTALLVDREARQRLAAEQAGAVELPALVTLDDLLAETDAPVEWVIDGLLVRDGKALLAAPAKSGKTTLTGNLVRSLADGAPFLDTFEVRGDLAGRVYVADLEMSRGQLRGWYRAWAVANARAVSVDALRGMASTLDLRQRDVRRRWVERLRGHDTAIFDPIGPVLHALGIDENSAEVGGWLEALDETMHDAGVRQYLAVHHTGHEGTRARGHSSLLGWPDALWNLRKDNADDPTEDEHGAHAPRFFSAEGRDVDVREALLTFNPADHRLTYEATRARSAVRAERAEARTSALLMAMLALVAADDGVPSGALTQALRDSKVPFQNGDEKKARDRLVSMRLVRVRDGKNNAKHHHITDLGRAWLEHGGEPPEQGELDLAGGGF